jgi:probable selenium-dependent hydroxylase accessory protein YqeC
MWHIQKIDPADLIVGTQYVAFVGAGGKSSLIEYLAGETAKRNKKTAITTTTKIYAREPYVLFTQNRDSNITADNPIRVGTTIEDGKLTALTFDDICELGKTFDTVLIEADGAKGKPLKYPAPHEPLIPPFSGMIFILAGLDSLFGRIDKKVFRLNILREKEKLTGSEIISLEIFSLFFTDEVLLKGVGNKPCVIVLNKYDAFMHKKVLFHITKEIIKKTSVERVIISSLAFRIFYEIRHFNPEP